MQDPSDTRKRAYEVLGLSPSASREEIFAAYARQTAAQPRRLQELTNAFHRLRVAESRLEEDLWHYEVAEASQSVDVAPAPGVTLHWDPELPAFEIDVELTDLSSERRTRDFRPIEFRPVTLTHVDRFDDNPATDLQVDFEK